jgi:hypothetical protein
MNLASQANPSFQRVKEVVVYIEPDNQHLSQLEAKIEGASLLI